LHAVFGATASDNSAKGDRYAGSTGIAIFAEQQFVDGQTPRQLAVVARHPRHADVSSLLRVARLHPRDTSGGMERFETGDGTSWQIIGRVSKRESRASAYKNPCREKKFSAAPSAFAERETTYEPSSRRLKKVFAESRSSRYSALSFIQVSKDFLMPLKTRHEALSRNLMATRWQGKGPDARRRAEAYQRKDTLRPDNAADGPFPCDPSGATCFSPRLGGAMTRCVVVLTQTSPLLLDARRKSRRRVAIRF
jgi:hypothetical protein